MEEEVRNRVVEKLETIVGSEYVSTNKADLYIHSYDLTPAEPHMPDILVLPKSLEELREIVRIAREERIPLNPYVGGGNIGGLAIPLKGGIILDLKRIDRILEINETDMYAVVEPGVTFGHMKAYLEEHHPDLMYTYAFSPPSTGVITNAILQGLDNLSFRYGDASHWVSGLEVLLSTGELIKIGSCAVSNTWQAVSPMPELTGLFLGWQGTTGIVTKMAVSLWPKPKFEVGLNFQVNSYRDAGRLFSSIARTRVVDDMIGTSFALNKISIKAMNGEKAPIYPAPEKVPGEPEFGISIEVSGNTQEELDAKVNVINGLVRGELGDMNIRIPDPHPSSRAGFPMQALGVLCSGGGLAWVGCYGPMSKWAETVEQGCLIEDKYNLCRGAYTRIMNEGHFVGLRWMIPYDKGDPETVRRVVAATNEQLDLVLKMGFLPYKTPVWAVRKMEELASPEWIELHRRVKKMMDPFNILNPGRWGAPAE
ncbi:MAG: FAD-binding oxidoreductase [Dehalococcoidales bacterium]|nr:FAD-binding oxidoreductase [Dehalococcoidales bacterium]